MTTPAERICIYPGSFDPITEGHLDIIRRAAALYDRVIVAVLRHPTKPGCFTWEERVDMIRRACAGIPNVEAASFAGLTTACARQVHACAMLRGLRAACDFESERELAQINQRLAPEIETVFLMARPEHTAISSSSVREMASYGCDLTGFVPEALIPEVLAKFQG